MGRPVSDRCRKGHDIAVVGRYPSSGRCKACTKESNLRYAKRPRTRRASRKDPQVSAAPLHAYIRDLGLRGMAKRLVDRYGGNPASAERKVCRLLSVETVSIYTADHICVALGRHPFELWGHAFYADLEEDDDVRAS